MKHTWKLVAALAGLAALPLVGCEGDTIYVERATAAAGVVSLSEPSIDFGMLDCGGTAPEARTITIKNEGDARVRWVARLDSTAHFSLLGTSSGELPPGGKGQLTLVAREIPADIDAGAVLEATLTLSTDDTLESQVYLPVKATAYGARLELVAPELADFGQVPVGVEAPAIPVMVKNVGNAPASVSLIAPPDPQFSFSWAGDGDEVEVGPGELIDGFEARFEPVTINPSSSAAVLSVSGPVCGKSFNRVDVKGQGLGGLAGVSPAVVDIGEVECGTQAGTRRVTIYNNGNAALGWSASLASGENFAISTKEGAIAPGGLAEIIVTPSPMPMTTKVEKNGWGDTLNIATTVAEPFEIPIRQTAYGAILAWSSTQPLEFAEQTMFVASAGKALTLENSGSAPADVLVTGPEFAVTPEQAKVAAGGKLELSVAYKPEQFDGVSSEIGVSVAGPLCQPLPGPVPVNGEGGRGVASAISIGGEGTATKRGLDAMGGCAIIANSGGRVACWGNNTYGQLGVSGTQNVPVMVPELTGAVSIASGGDFNCAVDTDGAVWCWGNNRNRRNNVVGKLGKTSGSTSTALVPVPVPPSDKVYIGHNIACALTKEGKVWCWGVNRKGNLGTGSSGSHANAPRELANFTDITSLALSSGGGCALRNDSTVWCWGYYTRGQVGSGSSSGTTARLQVSNLTDAVGIMAVTEPAKAGARCALKMDGTAVCWGNRRYGQLGNNENSSSAATTPVAVSSLIGAVNITGNHIGGCALMNDNTIQCWGRNRHGQVGDGSTSNRLTPVAVTGINDATVIAGGGKGTCAIVTGGSVKCWGNYGLGTSNTPVTLPRF